MATRRKSKKKQASASAAEDDAGSELVASLMARQKRALRIVVAGSLILAFVALWVVATDFVTFGTARGGVVYAKAVGGTAAITFCGVLATSLGTGFAITRLWMKRKAETERRAVVDRLGLAPDALLWVVRTFSPGKRGSSLDDET